MQATARETIDMLRNLVNTNIKKTPETDPYLTVLLGRLNGLDRAFNSAEIEDIQD